MMEVEKLKKLQWKPMWDPKIYFSRYEKY